jgi:hypothetical protein
MVSLKKCILKKIVSSGKLQQCGKEMEMLSTTMTNKLNRKKLNGQNKQVDNVK